jgi:hypothetical protein
VTQKQFLKIDELPELHPRMRGELHKALEDIFSTDQSIRFDALNRLVKLDAHRRSPLAISILVGRIIDPSLQIRTKIVEMISDCLGKDDGGARIPSTVRLHLQRSLSEIGEKEILALLELLSTQELLDQICYILNECSHCGESLVQFLISRNQDISIRIAASEAIGGVGFLEARSAIESFERRLSNLVSGQIPMSFAPKMTKDAEALLPVVRRTLRALE